MDDHNVIIKFGGHKHLQESIMESIEQEFLVYRPPVWISGWEFAFGGQC